MKLTKKLLSLALAFVLLFNCLLVLTACDKDPVDNVGGNKVVIDNETTRLVLSTSELDGVFNPFYSSSAADGSIVGMTQIGMLSADKDGKVACGPTEACVVLTYETEEIKDATGEKVEKTVYRFVLKNDLKFSNGSPLTMKDVLFNLYTYLDPAYYGSSTIYSTDIVGLIEYRTQSDNKSEQDNFNKQFDDLAGERMDRLIECIDFVYEEKDKSYTDAEMTEKLTEAMNLAAEMAGEDLGKLYLTVMDDYALLKETFLKELQNDYNMSRGTAKDILFTDKSGKEVTLTTDTEAFLYNEGYIVWDEDNYYFDYKLGADSKNWSEEQAINALYNTFVPNDLKKVLGGWMTGLVELPTYFAALEKQAYFDNIKEEDKINNVSGIRFANRTESYVVGGVTYDVPTYNADGSVASGNEILEITINEIDPKAIWNFAFTVAPMYYYSDPEVYKDFDYETNFGVKFGSREFQDNFIKNKDKIGVPVGAGPYKATNREGNGQNITAGTFRANNVVYFERNEHFMFDVKIKYVNYQVVSTNLMLEALYAGDVHFVEPSCIQENIDSINAQKNAGKGVDSTSSRTNGYGYIGINAEHVPDLNVRKAIMHAINTQLAVDYYFGYSDAITRPMTKVSWAYPHEKDDAGQYYKYDKTGEECIKLVEASGYTKNAKGVYQKGNHVLKYTFTVAGDTTDHPAYMSLKGAAEILNKIGFDVEVKTDINALKKLNNGDLAVWAAAWGAGVDPDMYQVYHIDSTAGSTNNWGYRAIKANTTGEYDEELELVERLSQLIDLARTTLDIKQRTIYYAQALDIVMELAVELPTYQRSDLFAYNTDIIDVTTLTPPEELTSYNGPLSRLWDVSLKETK